MKYEWRIKYLERTEPFEEWRVTGLMTRVGVLDLAHTLRKKYQRVDMYRVADDRKCGCGIQSTQDFINGLIDRGRKR